MLARITLLGAYAYGLQTYNALILWAVVAIAAALALKADHRFRKLNREGEPQ